jgi:hypothetical protein
MQLAAAACGGSRAGVPEAPIDVVGTLAEVEIDPGDEQELVATVTRGGAPVRSALVTTNVYLPQGGVRWYIGAPTNDEGRTVIRFRHSQSGYYFVEITALHDDEVVTTNGMFRVRRESD